MNHILTIKINRTFIYFAIVSFIFCALYSTFFVPVYLGDSADYVNMAKVYLGQSINSPDFSLRSPLYPLFLSIIIRLFGDQAFLKAVVYFQYLIAFLSSILVFIIFKRTISNAAILFLIGTLFIINFSTITFGFLIISETLTLFLYLCHTYTLIRYIENRNVPFLIVLGLISGFLVLVRFNLILMPLLTIVVLLIDRLFIVKPLSAKQSLLHLAAYVVSVFFVINIWCLVNLYTHGVYRLFPMSDISINRNAVLSTLNENNRVSEEHKRTLEIFLNAKRVVDSRRSPVLKGSFLELDANNYMHKLHSGYEIYIAALPELMKVYECNINNYENVLSAKLVPFYREISGQNKKEIFEMRVLSLLNGFRHSIASLPESFGNTNLNILPELIFKIYKILFAAAMAVFLIFTTLFLLKLKKKNLLQYYPALIILAQVLYFPVVNFLYITESNANRFKFPSEPLIIGLTIFYLGIFFRRKIKEVN